MNKPDNTAPAPAPTPADADPKVQKKAFKELRDSANKADLASSPALNDDADTDSGGIKTQTLPDGNRFKN